MAPVIAARIASCCLPLKPSNPEQRRLDLESRTRANQRNMQRRMHVSVSKSICGLTERRSQHFMHAREQLVAEVRWRRHFAQFCCCPVISHSALGYPSHALPASDADTIGSKLSQRSANSAVNPFPSLFTVRSSASISMRGRNRYQSALVISFSCQPSHANEACAHCVTCLRAARSAATSFQHCIQPRDCVNRSTQSRVVVSLEKSR